MPTPGSEADQNQPKTVPYRVNPNRDLFFNYLNEAALVYEAVRDEAGNIIDWIFRDANTAALQLLGLKQDELIDKKASELFGMDLVNRETPEIRRVLTTGAPYQREESFGNQSLLVSMFRINENTVARIATDITERKQAEDRLRWLNQSLAASEAKYSDLAESITDPFTAYDTNLRLFYRNRAAREATQIPDEQALGKTFSELFPDLAGTEVHQIYLQALKTHQPQRYLSHWVRPNDGVEFYFDLSVYPNQQGLVALSKDVTERVKAEAALIERNEALQKANEYATWMARFPDENPNPVARIGLDGKILYHNRPSAELSGWGFTKGVQVPDHLFSIIKLANTEGKRVEQDVQIGDRFYSITCMPFPNERYVNLYGLDITERKQAEEALRESEARERARANELEAVMDAAPAVIWISRDPECREMTGNHYSYEFLQIPQGENVSRTAPEIEFTVQQYRMEKDGRPVPTSELPMQIAAASGKPAQDYAFDLVYEDGTIFQLYGNVNPLFDGDGKPYGAIGVFVDLTTLRRLEADQIAAKAEIEVQRRLMDQREQERLAIARDLHDGPIQTLSSAAFHLQMIKEIFADQALHVELNKIRMDIKLSVQELRSVLNDLRPPALMHFGFSRVIEMYTESLCERFPDIEIDMDVENDDRLLSDQARLALFRIYQAGINNILRHSGASKAWVIYKIQQDHFSLEMRDNGNGFDISKDPAQLTREGHFGLVGMKERAEAIGGTFSIVSDPGKGTSILVEGPLVGKNLK